MSLARTLLLAGVAGATLAGVSLACGSTSATDIVSPITGVTIRAEAITEGRGCGINAGQVYKYAVVVTAESGSVVASNVYDCFADGHFVNLPPSPSYDLAVFVYGKASFDAVPGSTIAANASQSNAVQLLMATKPDATTRCTARQLTNVQTLAVCKPVQDGVTGVSGDAGMAPTESGADAGADAP